MGRPSFWLTAKMVRPIMSESSSWDSTRALRGSTLGSSGNSSGSMPWMWNWLTPHWIWTVSPSVVMLTMSSGSRRMMSPKSRADRTREPASCTSAGTTVRIPVSRL